MPALRASSFALACLLAGSCVPSAAAESIVLNDGQLQSLGIELVPAQADSAAGQGRFPGRVAVPVEQMRVVAAPVAGMLEMLAVAPGAAVRRGQALARLSSPQALELQRDALQAGSQAELARQNLERDEQLFAEGLIAESRLQASRAAAAQAGAQAAERRQGLALAGAVPGKVGGALALLSPIDGVVLEQGAQVGQRVDAATLIYRIAKLSPLWLEIQAPLALAGALAIGAPVRVAGTAARGKLIAVGRAVDPESQSVLLRAVVASGAEALRPGQAVEVEVEMPLPGARGLRLPAGALARHQGRAVVFVRDGSDARGTLFRPQPVGILGRDGDSVLVEGVRAGEIVAGKGVSGLKAVWTGVGKE